MAELTRAQHDALVSLLQAGPVARPLQELARRYAQAGRELYVVGGAVRDVLLGRATGRSDVDLATDARPEETLALAREGRWADAVWEQGVRFGTVGVLHQGWRFEVTTYRADDYRPDSRKPEVQFGTSIVGDLRRRDFTINAMAVRLGDWEFLDPFGGLGDLAAGKLRTPASPTSSFSDDPLRMLRAGRFMSQLGVTPVPGLTRAVHQETGRLAIVSRERIRDELSRLLVGREPGKGLWFVVRTGLAGEFLPELPALALEQDPVHRHKDVLSHTIAVVERASALDADAPDLVLRLAALLHDIGKPRTRRVDEHGVSFHHHEGVGARMAEHRLRELHYPAQVVEDVTQLVYLHLRFHTFRMGWTDSAVRRYARDAGPQLVRLNRLVRSDCTTRNASKARQLSAYMDELERRLAELQEREELASIRPPLDGREVMAHLRIPPGPLVGKALAHLLELRLDRGPMSVEEATDELDAWWVRQAAGDAQAGAVEAERAGRDATA